MIKGIHDVTMAQFADALGKVTSHSRPVEQVSHLKGRETQVNIVKQAIYAAGRHVFIFGERGVGKTSLAKAVGRCAVKPEHFRQFGCSAEITFDGLMRQVIQAFSPKSLASTQVNSSFGLSKLVSISKSSQENHAAQPTITVSFASDVLASLDNDQKQIIRVVVIDEVDRLTSSDVRRDLAELIKLLGDRGAKITFIFTGVGSDLTEILGSHPSSFRQLAQVHLKRISFQPALDIIDDALLQFGLDWEQEPTRTARFRIASIANGFPYYVHLLIEKLLYSLYHDRGATEVTLEHLRMAVVSAVEDAAEQIRKPYDLATRGRSERYKLAAWAAADSWDLERTSSDIYRSYEGLCASLQTVPIDQKKLTQTLSALKGPKYGVLLSRGYRFGQYEFSENIGRGYVRLCASAAGIELQDLSPQDSTSVTHATAREKRYIHPSRIGTEPSTLRR